MKKEKVVKFPPIKVGDRVSFRIKNEFTTLKFNARLSNVTYMVPENVPGLQSASVEFRSIGPVTAVVRRGKRE